MTVQAVGSGCVEGLRSHLGRGPHMAGLAVILFVAIHATIPIPASDLPMASPAEEVGVILGHGAHMAFLTALIAVTHEALVLVERMPQFAVRMSPLGPTVRFGRGLAVTGVAIVLGMAVQAHALIPTHEILSVGLEESRA